MVRDVKKDQKRQTVSEPDFMSDIVHIGNVLESHFKDMCDFEFCVQQGKVYVLGGRPGKRTGKAALRIALDLYLEKVITGTELLDRIEPEHLEEALAPNFVLRPENKLVASGLPASYGLAVGVLTLNSNRICRHVDEKCRFVFATPELSPDEWAAIKVEALGGLITTRGGMTSHASVVCRELRIPCVIACEVDIKAKEGFLEAGQQRIVEGEYISIDGSAGKIYTGKAETRPINWHKDKKLYLLLKLIDVLALENAISDGNIAKAWQLRDMLVHGVTPYDKSMKKWLGKSPRTSQGKRHSHISFGDLSKGDIEDLPKRMKDFQTSVYRYRWIWMGMRMCLFRQFARFVGIGRHYEYYRPLFDPMKTIYNCKDFDRYLGEEVKIQVVGEEFFGVNYHLPNYIEIESVRMYAAFGCNCKEDYWSVDRSNAKGEKLCAGSLDLVALKIIVNDAVVGLPVLPSFYNYFRKKEYFWGWYQKHGIVRQQIIQYLRCQIDSDNDFDDLVQACKEVGLISVEGCVTKLGRSLIERPTANILTKLTHVIGE